MKIKFDDTRAREILSGIETRLTDMTELFRTIGATALRAVMRNFEEQGRPRRWRSLTPVTKRARRGNRAKILQDTGQLKASIGVKTGDRWAEVGTNLEYAAIHQFGGVITARNARSLAIPLNPKARQKRPREWEGLFAYTSRAGHRILALRRGNRLVPMYILKRSVRIPARPFLSFTDEDIEIMRQQMIGWLMEGL